MKPLVFNTALSKQKPENIRNAEADCPFCHRETLQDILAEEGTFIWLKNKYPVLHDSYQTVIIEGDECYSEFSQFPLEKATQAVALGLTWWHQMIDSGQYRSVIYFKNHGPMSGGSIRHPHSQIVGFYEHDYRDHIKVTHFHGPLIYGDHDLRVTLSDTPLIGFYEFNIIARHDVKYNHLARTLQAVISYVMNFLSRFTESYNIFYYDLDDEEHFYIKVVPRYTTTPLFIGYGFPVITNEARTKELIEGVRHFLHKA